MANAYSEDLRKRAVKLVDEGRRIEEVGKLLGIGRSSIYLWLKQRREEGHIRPKEEWRKGYGHKIQDLEKFRRFVEKNEGLSGVEMAKKWGNITLKTMSKWLHRLGYTRKKRVMGTKKETKRNVEYIWKQSEQKIQLI